MQQMQTLYIVFLFSMLLNRVFGRECFHRTHNVIGNREIRLFNEKVTYKQAIVKCKAWGQHWQSGETGKLVAIRDIEDQRCIEEMISISTNYRKTEWSGSSVLAAGYYAGATDKETEGKWLWQDGTPMNNYINWARFEHERSTKCHEDCMQLLMINTTVADYKVGKWMDIPCKSKRYYICERELKPSLNWGYENNAHATPPSYWHELYPACRNPNQSPISLSISGNTPECARSHRLVKGWRVLPNSKWIVENTGRFIKITTSPPNSMWTSFYGSLERVFVDHLILKWGKEGRYGSEHAIGGIRKTGELQIFHKRSELTGVLHAFAFMLEERNFHANQFWNDLVKSISHVQEAGKTEAIPAHSSGIRQLLRDSSPSGNTHRVVLRNSFRYHGSVPHPPCTSDVLWTVFAYPIQLSFSQFRVLRSTLSEDGISLISDNVRPLQYNSNPICKVTF